MRPRQSRQSDVAGHHGELKDGKPELLALVGGREVMIESPLIQEIAEEFEQAGRIDMIISSLRLRFGAVSPNIEAGLKVIKDKDKFAKLNIEAATCETLEAFEEKLRQALPTPPPPSTRGKPKKNTP